jgi:cellobiose transport system permease protein
MTQYLSEALPYELIEAARVDGASMFRTFWSVALPAALPAAAMLGLFQLVQQWTNFFWPSIILTSENPTLPLVVQSLQANYFVDYSLVMGGIFLVTAPLLVLFLFVGRQLVAGIMAGAVKG